MAVPLTLYSYWRSSAAYRVRIALNLKDMDYRIHPVHLTQDGGQQHADEFRELNPQQLIPVLLDGDRVVRQSLAIIEYLDDVYPETLPLLPRDMRERARVRSLALSIACDVHPLGNLRVLQYLERELGASEAQRNAWSRHWIELGFESLEASLADSPEVGAFCSGDDPTVADCFLAPQVYNARRFGVAMDRFPTIERIDKACCTLDEFKRAAPEAQVDAPVAMA